MIRSFRSRLVAVSTGVLLTAATLGTLAPLAEAETASANVPATITASPTSGLVSGSTVTVSATADNNWNIYSLRARLCKSSATIDNAGDFSPTLGGNCIATPLAVSTDSDVTVTTTAGNRGSASLDFKVGAGTETFTTQYDGDVTIACGTTSTTGCKLVVEMSANNLNGRVIYKSFPLTYALPNAPTGVSAVWGNAKAVVSWNASASQTGLPAVTSYTVTSSPGDRTCTTATTSCEVSGLTNGTAYTFTVTGTSALGDSSASSASVAVTPSASHYVLSSTPTSGLVSGDTVAQSVSMSNGFNLYSVRTRLCKSSATINNAGDFSPTLGGNCIASALSNGTDSDVTVTTTAGNRGSASLNFKVGAGSTTFTTQYDGSTTIACGTASTASACALVTELSYTTALNAGRVVYVSTPITFNTIPAAPTSLNATPRNGSASIAFTAGSNGGAEIMNYEYSLNGGSTWLSFPEMVMSSPVTVPGLTNGTSYEIKLRALNSVGNGTASAAVSVTPRTTPAAPTALVATPGAGSASIEFVAGSNGGSAITKYQYSTDGGTDWSDVASGTSSPVSITGLAKGQTYSIKLRAVSAAGDGAPSTATSVSIAATVPNAPAAPTVVVGAAGGSATASWTAPANGGSAITGYEVTATGGATPIVKSITNPATLSQAFTGLSKTTTYTFTVKAINAIGKSVASAGTSKLPVTVPGKPATILLGSTGNGSITVTYTAPTIDGGSAVTGYTVKAFAPLATVPADVCDSNASTLTCTLTGLTNGVKYSVKVFAVNAAGTGTASSSLSNVIPATTPGKPTITTVTAGAGQVTVAWTAPVSNGGSAITGYTVQAFNAAGTVAIDSKTCTPATATGTNCIVTGLTNGTAYTFKVTAANVKGSGSASDLSATATPAAAPAAPGSPQATANTGKKVTISWTAPANNGSPITGYTVTAYTWNGSLETIVTPAKKCTTTSATTCTISLLTAGTQYKFKITATNAKGTSTAATTAAVTALN